MGNSHFVAKETYHPFDDAFIDQSKGNQTSLNARLLRNEPPLKMTKDDKLKMITEDTSFKCPNGVKLYKMRNLGTNESGLVPSDLVAKSGTIDCEPYVLRAPLFNV